MSAIGIFGDYKYKYSSGNKPQPSLETVWVSKPYDPTDLRSSAPVSRHKPVLGNKSVEELSSEWVSVAGNKFRD